VNKGFKNSYCVVNKKYFNEFMAARPIFEDATAGPGAHALVIGVNGYPHLQGGPETPAERLAALRQLTSPVPSATHFANWVLGSQGNGTAAFNNPKVPLKSLRVLLSPGPLNLDRGSFGVDPATLANIQDSFNAWLASCNSNPENIAIFYFCGHGFQRQDICLLPEDFGAPDAALSRQLINFSLTWTAMEQCRAATQCYFIDACRDTPPDVLKIIGQTGVPLKDPVVNMAPPRDAPIYFASGPGHRAEGAVDGVSPFSHALVECLRKYGACTTYGTAPWWVSTESLATALGSYLERLGSVRPSRAGETTTSKPTRICSIAQPEAQIELLISPNAAHTGAALRLTKNGATAYSRRDDAHPWREFVSPGSYQLEVDFVGLKPCRRDEYIAPPVRTLEVEAV
jgi:hypothetical protein